MTGYLPSVLPRLTTLAVLASLAFPVASATAAEKDRRILAMTGTGEVRGTPDNATLSTGVITQGRTAAGALAANTKAMAATLSRLKAFGIAERDLQTSNFSVSPRYFHKPNSNEPPRIVGYTVSNQLTVVIRELDDLGRVLDAVVSLGANQVSGPNFGFKNPEDQRDTARTRAAADALRKAKLYAKALNLTLGPIVSVNESGRFSPQPVAMAMRMEVSRVADVPIESGEIGLKAEVNVVWELK